MVYQYKKYACMTLYTAPQKMTFVPDRKLLCGDVCYDVIQKSVHARVNPVM